MMIKRLRPEEEVRIDGVVRIKNPMRHAIMVLIEAPLTMKIETVFQEEKTK